MDWNTIIAELPKYYADNLRSNFFNGFLTIGAFLVAVKTFIVAQIKQDIFDKPFYKERIERHRKLNPSKAIKRYQPLQNLGDLLFYAALSSIISACLQLTVGLIPSAWAVIVCVMSAIIAVIMLTVAMLVIKRNLNVWFEELDKHD